MELLGGLKKIHSILKTVKCYTTKISTLIHFYSLISTSNYFRIQGYKASSLADFTSLMNIISNLFL